MDKPIFIDATKKSIDQLWGENKIFTINMSGDSMELESDTENYIALLSLTMSYTRNNIDVNKFNNNKLSYSSSTGGTSSIVTLTVKSNLLGIC